MSSDPTVTYLELRASTPDGELAGGLTHKADKESGLVLLHVQELAPPGEPRGAVTIVHDAGAHGGRYLGVARALAESGWAVALPDLRGHGRSEGERGHSNGVREVLRDLGDVQDHLAYRQPEAPKVLVGHGLGAVWCLAYACEKPGEIAGLVLAAPLLEPRFELPKAPGGLAGLFKKVGPTSAGKIGWSAERLTSDASEQRARSADPLMHDAISLRAGEEAIATASKYRARVGELAMPVLVLAAKDDAIASSTRVDARTIERVEVAGAHDLFHDRGAREASDAIARWLDRVVPR